ncbi:MAG TPA: phage protein Gp36 family protein [Chthoniobacterales bacterium]
MPYLTLDNLRGAIPAAHLLEALDDDNDGAEDAGIFDLVAAQAGEQIDGLLSARFTVPFAAPLPSLVSLAARTFACELIYKRRGVEDDKNPWAAQANALRKQLQAIGSNLSPAPTDFPTVAKLGAVIIAEPSRTASRSLAV